jgi:hypothetical protein
LEVPEYSQIPERRYCPKCREHFTESLVDHHNDHCVYEIGCPTCRTKYMDKYHAENCKKAEVWKKADLPPLFPIKMHPLPSSTLPPIPPKQETKPTTMVDHLLSRGKPAEASSTENNFFRADSVTGRTSGNRWSSKFNDHEWITIEIGRASCRERV